MSDTLEKHLSDVIDLERDILPYRMVQVIAGVGAGKNYWVNQIAHTKRPGDDNYYSILLITSRAVTANAQAEKMKADRWIDLDHILQIGTGLGFQRGTVRKYVVTNAGIENFLKAKYSPTDLSTHIWNKFDFIVLDEAHSLASDAVFSDSPFYVHQFLRCACRHNPNCHIILMTGTPDPINWLFPEELKNNRGFHTINVLKQCIHVVPKRVILEPLSDGLFDVIEELRRGNKVLYFATTIGRIKKIFDFLHSDKFLRKSGITAANIGIIFSNTIQNIEKAKKQYGFTQETLDKMEDIRDNLVIRSLIPDDIRILITTSTLKEGIDINNDDFKTVFAETVVPSELTQMAGRLRNGVNDLRVLYPSKEALSHYKKIDYQQYTEQLCLEQVNTAYQNYAVRHGELFEMENSITRNESYLYILFKGFIDRNSIIKYIHATFQNIRYDYFTDSFLWYSGKEEGHHFNLVSAKNTFSFIDTWFLEDYHVTDDGSLIDRSGEGLFQQCFPESVVYLWNRKYASFYVKRLIRDSGCWNVELTKKQRDALLETIISTDIEILEKAITSDGAKKLLQQGIPSQPKSFFKCFWVDISEVPGKRKGSKFLITDLPFENASAYNEYQDSTESLDDNHM